MLISSGWVCSHWIFIRLVLPQDETIHRRDRNDDMSCSSCDGSNQKEQECFSIYCDDGFIIWRMTVTFKKYLIYRSQCRVMEYMYTTIFFFTFNYRIHYKTKLKTPGEWVINIFLNKIKLSFIDALYRIINGHNSTINSQFYIFIITTNINWIYINDFFILIFYFIYCFNAISGKLEWI